jgi:beta-glucosidase
MLLEPLIWSYNHLEETLYPFSRTERIEVNHSGITPVLVVDAPSITDYVKKYLKAAVYFGAVMGGSLLALPALGLRAITHPSTDPRHRFDNMDWTKAKIDDLFFPKNMFFGAATADFQANGKRIFPHSTWAKREIDHHIPLEQSSDLACDYWTHMDDVIARAKELHFNSLRISVERCAIEPQEGIFNQESIDHYVTFCKKLKDAGIEPIVTLHHFNDPLWFANKGGFENEENIADFVRYCDKICDALSRIGVKYIFTFNEPALYSFTGYVMGDHPPEKPGHFKEAAEVLECMLRAHVQVYQGIKAKHPDVKLGIVHDVLRTVPYHSWNPIEIMVARYMTRITNDVVMRFFKTDEFAYQLPGLVNRRCRVDGASKTIDVIGVNYYSDPMLCMKLSKQVLESSCYPKQEMSALTYPGRGKAYRVYPEGLYSAIAECSELAPEVMVTENGIVTGHEDQRALFYRRALWAVSQACRDGYNVTGYQAWTLDDCSYEWTVGWTPGGDEKTGGFGLFSFDRFSKVFALKDGARAYKRIIQKWTHPVDDEASLEMS